MKRQHPNDSSADVTSLPVLSKVLAAAVPFAADPDAPSVRIVVSPPREPSDENTQIPGELDDTLPFFRPHEQPIMTLQQFVTWSIHARSNPERAKEILESVGASTPNAERRALGYWQHRIRTDDLMCHRFRALRDAQLKLLATPETKGDAP